MFPMWPLQHSVSVAEVTTEKNQYAETAYVSQCNRMHCLEYMGDHDWNWREICALYKRDRFEKTKIIYRSFDLLIYTNTHALY